MNNFEKDYWHIEAKKWLSKNPIKRTRVKPERLPNINDGLITVITTHEITKVL